MITPMQHLTLICRQEDRSPLLLQLREFGAVHVTPVSRDDHDLEALRSQLSDVRNVLQKLLRIPEPIGEPMSGTPEEIIAACAKLSEEHKDLSLLQNKILRERRAWEPFGTIQPSTLADLRKGGLSIAFYRSGAAPEDLPETAIWLPAETGYGVAIDTSSLEQVKTPSLPLPVRGPERLLQLESTCEKLAAQQEQTWTAAAFRMQDLQTYQQQFEDELALKQTYEGMEGSGELAWIEGYLPEGKQAAFETLAAS